MALETVRTAARNRNRRADSANSPSHRHPAHSEAPGASPAPTSWTSDLATHVNELAASMRNDATALDDINGILHLAIDDITHDYDHEKARRIANRITAATVHAMTLIAALQRNAGRFEAVAQCVELGEAEANDTQGGR